MGGSQIKLSEKESADGKSAERKPKEKVNDDVQRRGGGRVFRTKGTDGSETARGVEEGGESARGVGGGR